MNVDSSGTLTYVIKLRLLQTTLDNLHCSLQACLWKWAPNPELEPLLLFHGPQLLVIALKSFSH